MIQIVGHLIIINMDVVKMFWNANQHLFLIACFVVILMVVLLYKGRR